MWGHLVEESSPGSPIIVGLPSICQLPQLGCKVNEVNNGGKKIGNYGFGCQITSLEILVRDFIFVCVALRAIPSILHTSWAGSSSYFFFIFRNFHQSHILLHSCFHPLFSNSTSQSSLNMDFLWGLLLSPPNKHWVQIYLPSWTFPTIQWSNFTNKVTESQSTSLYPLALSTINF